jgi:hypothetical protein
VGEGQNGKEEACRRRRRKFFFSWREKLKKRVSWVEVRS